MKKSLIKCTAVLAGVAVVAGCASILTGTRHKIQISSSPSDATVTIYDKRGNVYPVETNRTPAVVKLGKKGEGYFQGAEYRIVVEKTGFKPAEFAIRAHINGWYFGNFFIGGLIGFLAVDPLTGGMWTLSPDKIQAELGSAQAVTLEGGHVLIVTLKEQLDAEHQQNLVPLQNAIAN